MNHIYRSIRNEITGAVVTVSELAKSGGKKSSSGRSAAVSSVAAAIALLSATSSEAAPMGGTVVAGNASITSTAGNTTISQSSQNAVLNWQSFNIGTSEAVTFVQPNSSSVALNRVLGSDASSILGNLSANGKIFLVNPNGILFGTGAQVNVGSLIASTRNITDSDFLAGQYNFNGSSNSSIVNRGSINTDGGYVALLGANVSNQGVIVARLGSVTLAAGNAMTLDVAGDGLLNVTVNAGAVDALVQNGGLIQANGGQVLLTAQSASSLLQSAVNNTGVIQAQTIENHNGTIKLIGDMQSGTVNVGGTLDASAPTVGNGGFIETSAAHVKIASDAIVTTRAPQGSTGQWLIDPVDFTIAASGGDITGAALGTLLSNNSVTVQTTTGSTTATDIFGATGSNGDVNVNDTVSWSANQLTLNAQNNININSSMSGSGTASLALIYGQGSVAAGNASTVNVHAPVDLPTGNNLSMQQGSDGVVVNYEVINDVNAIQHISGNLAGHYALGSNVDASATSSWNAGAGFAPIGNDPARFSGIFDGLGHTVSGLYIDRTGSNFTGLFGYTAAGSIVRNIGLLGGSVTSDSWSTGSLVGALSGTLLNSYATTDVNGFQTAGGLVGVIDGGLILDSHASGTVVSNGNGEVGGLVGLSWGPGGGTTRNSYATGNVSSSVGNVGGLMGINWGTVIDSYATGTATGTDYVGGLIGNNSNGSIANSYATGAVTGNNYVGGLAGNNSNSITDSHATGTVNGIDYVGGITGSSNGTSDNNYTSSIVVGRDYVGGLIGSSMGTTTNNHATGTVAGRDRVGGLVGDSSGTLSTNDASGAVTASGDNVGGLIGYSAGTTITDNHASGAVTGNYSVGGLVGRNAAGMFGFGGSTLNNNYASGSVAGASFVGGLIGTNYVVVTNSHATGSVTGGDQIGGLVGGLQSGSISNSYATGDVVATTGAAGGLVGYASAPISNSYASGAVTGIYQVGGILGAMNGSSIDNSYATSAVTGTGNVGGLVGNSTNGTISNVYATGAVSGSTDVGGLLGSNDNATINNGFWDVETSGQAISAGGTGLTTAELQAALPAGFSPTLWGNVNNQTTPYLLSSPGSVLIATDTSNTYYSIITSLDQLQAMNANLAGNYALANNIDASATSGWNSGAGFVPVGTGANAFVGNFDGLSHSINDLTINRPTTDYVGLFGYTMGGTISHLGLVNAQVTGKDNVGALLGGTVVGYANYNYATGTVTGQNSVGGLIGYSNTTRVGYSYASNTVTGSSKVGGLMGETNGGILSAYNYATGNVVAAGDYVGGLVGYNGFAFVIAESYATGNVTGASNVGGLVGYHLNGAIDHSYATGAVNASGNVGGLVGYTDTGSVSNSFWNSDSSGQMTSAGGTALTATQMQQQANFTGWDFTNNWIGYDGHTNPLLRTFMTELTVTANDATKTYNGQAYNGSAGVSYSTTPNMSNLLGTLDFSSGINAGTTAITTSGLYSNQQGYIINYASGTLTINKAVLTATATATNKTYDGNNTASATLTGLTGLVGSETINASGTATFNSKDVATANLVTINSTTLTNGTNGGLASNYSLASGQTASASITAKSLTATVTAPDKVYDGNTTASATLVGLTGFVGTETVSASGNATFNSKDVAAANLVTVNSTTLTNGTNGGLASNYSLASGQTVAANITAKTLTATVAASDKVYDGNATASATLNGLTGLIGSEIVSATGTATFNSKDVATANLVTVNSTTLTNGTNGGLGSNYNLAGGQTVAAAITAKTLTATVTAPGKVYDGSDMASATLSNLTGLVGTETVSATGTATFNSKDVVSANLVTVNSTTLSNGSNGGLASNYSLASGQTVTANITAKTLSATATALNKTYDGTTTASATLVGLTGLVGSETIAASGTATFNRKDVASANLVTVNSTTLTNGTNGGLASNYSLASGQTVAANITAKALTATAIAASKVYDGNTTASATLTVVTGLVGTETVSASGTATFNSKDAASANLVTVNSATLTNGNNGGLASNYSLASGQTVAANITAKTLTATVSAPSKVYDGNTTASATLSGLTGLVGSETVGANGNATFNSKDVASANLVTVNSTTLTNGTNGGLASNYSLASGQTVAANITAKMLTATVSAPNKVYDGTTTANATLNGLSGFVGSETVNASGTATFNSKDVASANLVTFNSTTLTNGTNGGLASNYGLASGQTVAANITPKSLTVVGQFALEKVYDGTLTTTLTGGSLVGVVAGETVALKQAGLFATAHVGNGIAVTATDSLGGIAAANYTVTQPTGLSANIVPIVGYQNAMGAVTSTAQMTSVDLGATLPANITASVPASDWSSVGLTSSVLAGLNLTIVTSNLNSSSSEVPQDNIDDKKDKK